MSHWDRTDEDEANIRWGSAGSAKEAGHKLLSARKGLLRAHVERAESCEPMDRRLSYSRSRGDRHDGGIRLWSLYVEVAESTAKHWGSVVETGGGDVVRSMSKGWEIRTIGALSSAIRLSAATWDANEFYAARRRALNQTMVARSVSSEMEVRTYVEFNQQSNDDRFVTERRPISRSGAEVHGPAALHASNFRDAIENHEKLAAPIIGMLDTQEQMLDDGGHELMLEGVL